MARRGMLAGFFIVAMTAAALAQAIPLEGLSFNKKMRLARAGDDVAQMAIGMHFERGDATRQDMQQAARWYRESTLKGNLEGQYRLAKLISRGGKGLAADKVAAATLFQAGADKGHPASQNELGLLLQTGAGIDADVEKAVEWFKKSSDQGYIPAKVNLGLLFVRGQGVARNYDEAVQLFQVAAREGDSWAFNNLGSMHEMGWGVSRDINKAREFYSRAVELGNKMAAANLKRLDGAAESTGTTLPTEEDGTNQAAE